MDAPAEATFDVSLGDSMDSMPSPRDCSGAMQCVTAVPAGWSGPVTLWVSSTGAPPACGDGFAVTPVFDGNAGLTAGDPTCSSCSCSPPAGVACTSLAMSFYVDDMCTQSIGSPLVLTTSCVTTPIGALAAMVAGPIPTGGACGASGVVASAPPASWAQRARACAPSSEPGVSDCDAGQVCAPVGSEPFSTQACVMQAAAAATCPPEYPAGPYVFYSGLNDNRGCSPCECATPGSGACTIASPAAVGCISSASWDALGTCSGLTGPEPVRLIANPALTDAGACAVADGGTPQGMATPTGPTSFCCMQ
jgi:hypothetical protein